MHPVGVSAFVKERLLAIRGELRIFKDLRPERTALVVVLGDGADWIWHAAARFLALRGVELVEIVDIYHAWEHLWTVANAVFGSGSAAAAAWVAPLKRRLEQDGVAPVLTALTA